MASTSVLPLRGRSPAPPMALLVALITLVLLAVSLYTAFRQVVPTTAERLRVDAATGPGPFAMGRAVRTSIGVVTVTGVERLRGTSSRDLAGANHGIAGYVPADRAQVQVSLRVTNDSVRALTWSPSDVVLRVGAGSTVGAQSATMTGGRLGAGASVEGNLGFVVPRDGSALVLELPADGGGRVSVELGSLDVASVIEGDGHDH